MKDVISTPVIQSREALVWSLMAPFAPAESDPLQSERRSRAGSWAESAQRTLRTFGPGLMVCLADTDGACLVTAAESGARERYKLLALQLALIPVLYLAQELTIRLALFQQQGLVGCVRSAFGRLPALLIAVPLIVSCVAAFVTEIANVASALDILGVPSFLSAAAACFFLLGLALGGSYSTAEKVGLAVGSLQVVFFPLAVLAGPSALEVLEDARQFPIASEPRFGALVTANIGAVIMPWMLAYQQSAMAREMNSVGELEDRRFETKVGSVVTQGVMSSVLVMAAATGAKSIASVDDLAAVVRQLCGSAAVGNAVTLAAVIGACLVAAIVVMLCAAWVIEDLVQLDTSPAPLPAARRAAEGAGVTVLERVAARPAYFAGIILSIGAALLVVGTCGDSVGALDVWAQILNGLLMVPIIAMLWYLTAFRLPEAPLAGPQRWGTGFLFLACCVFSVYGVVGDVVSRM